MKKIKIENDELFGITSDRLTNTVPDYTSIHPLLPFIADKRFKPLREMIDKKFNLFFNKFISLGKQNEEIKKSKQKLLKVFYSIVYQRIIHNPYLSRSAEILMQNWNKKRSNVFSELEVGAALKQLKPIIDEVFEIPDLVLTAFESSVKNFKKKMNRYGGLDISDPAEQKLFKAVWKINKECIDNYKKFSPDYTFKQINDKMHYVKDNLIQPIKFTTTPLYNRYKQYRKRQQKKNRNSIRLPK